MSPSNRLSVAVAVFIATGVAVPAYASIVYQSVPNLYDGNPASSYCSSCGGDYRTYDTLQLNNNATINQIMFDANSNYFFPTTVNVGIFTVVGGLPGAQLFSESFSSFVSVVPVNGTIPFDVVTVNPIGLSLLAGMYDISFYSPINYASVQFAVTNPLGPMQLELSGSFTPVNGRTTGFSLSSAGITTTPIPAALPLFGSALLGLIALGRRRITKTSKAV
jgi:hypothetical protein